MKINGKPNKYTFNLADNRKNSKGSGHDFEKINRGFYDELEEQDYLLKEGKQSLKTMKNKAIKECVYTNKAVPQNWKSKLNYQDDLLKLFKTDERFVAYLGKGGGSIEPIVDPKNIQTTEKTFPKIRNIHSSKESCSFSDKNEEFENNTKTIKPKFTVPKKTNELNEKEILNILDDFRNSYPINKPETNTMNKTMTTQGSNGWLSLRHMKIEDKQEMFKKSIYTNLLPSANTSRAKSSMPKLKKYEEKKTDYGPFLNFDYEAFNKKIQITNANVKKHLEGVNYFGPYYAHCPSCSNRNLEFYQNMEPNQCVELLKHIKKARGRTAVIKPNIEKIAKM